jgi:hypothetical protein
LWRTPLNPSPISGVSNEELLTVTGSAYDVAEMVAVAAMASEQAK